VIGKLLGPYQILEELGGNMAVVYRAHDTKLRRDIALKVLPPDRTVTQNHRERFVREARAAAALHHPNICTVYDVGELDGVWYISMAYIPGRTLKDTVAEGPFDVTAAINVAIQAAHGLQAAHDHNIVHRDIKSANIMIGEKGRVSILDFGIVKLTGSITQTGERRTIGTVAYMSPEQAGGEDVDHRTDLWSLGVCLYEMIAGRLPFDGDHDSAVIYQIVNKEPPRLRGDGRPVPPAVEGIVAKALQKKPGARYQNAEEMIADLRRARTAIDNGVRTEPSVAVLPFANMSADRNQQYFCDGIAEEIINSLTCVEGLRVAARTSSFAFRDGDQDVRDIGRRLGVDSLLEGSVQKAGERLRITVQLINTSDGYHLWSERFDRDLEDVFAIQDEIARSVVQALRVRLTESEARHIGKVPTADVHAYDFYVRGLHHYHQMTRKELEYARNMFTSAIIRDPNYALAFCGLADSYSMIHSFYDQHHSHVENALTASRKALEIDPELAQAHASHGLAASLDGRYEDAETEFQAAIERSPKLYEAYYFWARACRAQGDLRKAAEMFEKAGDVRPEDYQAPILAGDTYRGLDRVEDMHRAFRRGLALAQKHVELHPEEARAWYLGAHAHFELGDRTTALQWNEQAMKLTPTDPAALYNAACLFCLMGETERGFQCLEKAVEHGFSNRRWLENDPDLNAVRSDPRYARLIESISPPPAPRDTA